ncbi:MAG: hypothetical protein ACFFCS_01515 [Candidatus Hodarchaeota archaeon]
MADLEKMLNASLKEIHDGLLEKSLIFEENMDLDEVKVMIGENDNDGSRYNFGFSKRGNEWIIENQYVPLHEPILTREIILASLPRKIRKNASLIEFANWIAYTLASNAGIKQDFWDAWYSSSREMEENYVFLSPVLLREFRRISDVEPVELFKHFVNFVKKTGDLLGMAINIGDKLNWGMKKSATYFRKNDPDTMNILVSASWLYIKHKRVPSKQEIFQHVKNTHYFTEKAPSSFKFDSVFPVAGLQLCFSYLINFGLLDKVLVCLFCSINPELELSLSRLYSILDFHGLLLKVHLLEGSLDSSSSFDLHTFVFFFFIPRGSFDSFIRYIKFLKEISILEGVKTFVFERFKGINNYNNYYEKKGFVFSRDKGIDDLYHSIDIDYTQNYSLSVNKLINSLNVRNVAKFALFLDQCNTPIHFVPTRFGAEQKRFSKSMELVEKTYTRWLDRCIKVKLLTTSHNTNYSMVPIFPISDCVFVFTRRKFQTDRERKELAVPFMRTSIAWGHSLTSSNETMLQLFCPSGTLGDAIEHVYNIDPNANVMVNVTRYLLPYYKNSLAWIDWKLIEYQDLEPMFGDYEKSIKDVMMGKQEWKDHVKNTHHSWTSRYNTWKESLFRTSEKKI